MVSGRRNLRRVSRLRAFDALKSVGIRTFNLLFVFSTVAVVIAVSPVAQAQQRVGREKVFELKDLDGNKSLDKEEFSGGSIGKMREKSDAEFDRKDLDKDGEMSLQEFLQAANWTEKERKTQAAEEFLRLDSDDDGEITRDDYSGGQKGVRLQYAKDRFDALDANGDDVLDVGEFIEFPNLWKIPKIAFQYRDTDKDNELTEEEFLEPSRGKPWEQKDKQRFREHDLDRSKTLSLKEFLPLQKAIMLQNELNKIPKEDRLLVRYDKDGDAAVSMDEFLENEQTGKAPVAHRRKLFGLLDSNHDGRLQRNEINQIAASKNPLIQFMVRDANGDGLLAYNEQVPDGLGDKERGWRHAYFDLRDLDNSKTLSTSEFGLSDKDRRVLFRKRDRNRDGGITVSEQVGSYGESKLGKWLRADFRARDLDRDGIVSPEEFAPADNDPEIQYRRDDADRDGGIDVDEYVGARDKKWEAFNRNEFTVRDLDGDGRLNREENSMAQDAPVLRVRRADLDHDGAISIDEFIPTLGKKWQSTGKDAFAARDLNDDGLLNDEEFLMPADSPILKFRRVDANKDGSLDVEEFVEAKDRKWETVRRKTFALHDTNRDGRLSVKEFSASEQQAARNQRLSKLPPEERRFAMLDESQDGRVSFREYLAGHDTEAFSKEHHQGIFKVLDQDYDSHLSLNEFLARNPRTPRLRFAHNDLDANLLLSQQEFLQYVPRHEQQMRLGDFAQYDSDSDGHLTVDEYVQGERRKEGGNTIGAAIAFVSDPVNWLVGLVVVVDVILVWLIGRALIRRFANYARSRREQKLSSEG